MRVQGAVAFAQSSTERPIGPAPRIAIFMPAASCESRTACRPIESGSTSMASSSDMEAGTAAQQTAGAT